MFCSVYILGNQTQLITQSVNWLLIGNKYKIDRFLRKVLQIFTEGFKSVSFFFFKKNEMHSHVYVHDKNLVLKRIWWLSMATIVYQGYLHVIITSGGNRFIAIHKYFISLKTADQWAMINAWIVFALKKLNVFFL